MFESKFYKLCYFLQVVYFILELKLFLQDDVKDECWVFFLEFSIFLLLWLRFCKVESLYLVRDVYQCCEIVVLLGVLCLYFNFDLRCVI